jgi:hypothetical protein
MTFQIMEETIARQPPEALAIIRALLAQIAELKAELEDLRRQVKGKTPQNPRCRQVRGIRTLGRRRENASRSGNGAGSGTREARAGVDSRRKVR